MPETIRLTIGHSPDADDAFMWWPLGDEAREPEFDTGRFRFSPVAQDIEALNRRAVEKADLDITAISMRTYADVQERYILTAAGASFGLGYGPKVVAPRAGDLNWLRSPDVTIAIPGKRTTAYLVLRLMRGREARTIETPFQDVIPAVLGGRADAALVIHEAQMSYPESGLSLIADLGAWWQRETGLPLPLGANAARRDLDSRFGAGTLAHLGAVLRESVQHAMANRTEALAAAGEFSKGTMATAAQVDEFVGLYVNRLSVDAGEEGRRAIEELIRRGASAGLCPASRGIELI